MFAYFFPIFGAMLSDGFLGKYKTILYVSLIYGLGCVVLALASVKPLDLPPKVFSLLGLLLIAIGTGGIKPSVISFGGDQFVLPQQQKQLALFFAIFTFQINLGSFLSTIVTPLLREVHCFGETSCFSLAFGTPAILMAIGIGKSKFLAPVNFWT